MATRLQYVQWIFMLIDGDDYDIENMYKALQEDGYCDEDGFPIYDGEEDA
jgi:hypothetical protein